MRSAEMLALLRALDARADGEATQREVAVALGLSKVEARRCLRAAVGEGLVTEKIDDSPAAPRRRLFSVTTDRGRRELDRLTRRDRPSGGGGPVSRTW